MKKLLFFVSAFLAFSISILAQESVSEEVPVENLILKKGNIPPQIIKSAEQLFQGNTQVAWGVFPYELKGYGWNVNKDYNDPINHYEIQIKGKDGSDIYAVFESTGELISCKIINKNSPPPKVILDAIAKGEYKDWKITGDVMKIKNTQKKTVEHYAVKLEKGNMKKTLYFTTKGELLPVN
jgi:hypothetical protein